MQLGKLQRAVVGAQQNIIQTLQQLDEIKRVINKTPALAPALYDRAESIRLKLLDLQEHLTGDPIRAARSQTSRVSISSRVQTALGGTLQQTYGPTRTHRAQYGIALTEFKQLAAALAKVLKTAYQPLLRDLDKAGAPWTAGRPVPRP